MKTRKLKITLIERDIKKLEEYRALMVEFDALSGLSPYNPSDETLILNAAYARFCEQIDIFRRLIPRRKAAGPELQAQDS